MVLLTHMCLIADMYLSVIGDSCSIMSNDYELTMDYDMIVSLGKGWFQSDRYDCLDIWNMCEQLQETFLVLTWQGNSWCVYITNSWVMWQCIVSLDCNKVKKVKERNWVRIPLAMFGNPNSKWMSALHIGSLLNLDFSDTMWICTIFMNMFLKGITTGFQLWLDSSRNWSPLRDDMCMCSVIR